MFGFFGAIQSILEEFSVLGSIFVRPVGQLGIRKLVVFKPEEILVKAFVLHPEENISF